MSMYATVLSGLLNACKQKLNYGSVITMNIGIFLGYEGKVALSGEGIMRYAVRLAEGLLGVDANLKISVSTNQENAAEVREIFSQVAASFEDSIQINDFQDIKLIEERDIDVWVVPYVGMELALKLRKPIIVCLHDLVYIHFREGYYNIYPDFCRRIDYLARAITEKAEMVVFSSEYVRDNEGLSYLKLPADKVRLIRPAPILREADLAKVTPESEFKVKYQLANRYIVYPSVIRLHKNHARLIDAFLQFRRSAEGQGSEIELAITDNYQTSPNCQEIASVLKRYPSEISALVRFLGRLPSNDIPALYRYASGTIIPTLFEGSCPFPIFESLAMDTPVAFGRIPVVTEVIESTAHLITFDPYSTASIKEAIAALQLGSGHISQQKAAFSGFLKRSWQEVAKEYLQAIYSRS